jgi:hypothetical protein
MVTTIGVVVLIVGLICWIGQSLTFLVPSVAVKLGLLESEEEMDPTLHIIEARALGLNDMLLTWTLPLSALLMLLEHPLWPYLALIGGAIYTYFSGLIILSRVYLKRRGKKVGRPSSERAAYVFSVIWILSSFSMIALASIELST